MCFKMMTGDMMMIQKEMLDRRWCPWCGFGVQDQEVS